MSLCWVQLQIDGFDKIGSSVLCKISLSENTVDPDQLASDKAI